MKLNHLFDYMFARRVVRSLYQHQYLCFPIRNRLLSTIPPLKMPSKDKYTDPELRDEVKEEIHQSDKGGAPGQWSARKVSHAWMMSETQSPS